MHHSVGIRYLDYLQSCLASIGDQKEEMEKLFDFLESAGATHIYGFGRSGAVALSLAIRLRHFHEYIGPVWWIGDQVRLPIRKGDLVILFSGSGDRKEVEVIGIKAKEQKAKIFLVTSNRVSDLAKDSEGCILFPRLEKEYVYGGGDFEFAAYFFQEILALEIGRRWKIPKEVVERNHV